MKTKLKGNPKLKLKKQMLIDLRKQVISVLIITIKKWFFFFIQIYFNFQISGENNFIHKKNKSKIRIKYKYFNTRNLSEDDTRRE